LVFITEMKSVYSAVRTGSLNKAVCASSLRANYILGNKAVLEYKIIYFYLYTQVKQHHCDWPRVQQQDGSSVPRC